MQRPYYSENIHMHKTHNALIRIYLLVPLFMLAHSNILCMDGLPGNPVLIAACEQGNANKLKEFLDAHEDENLARIFWGNYKLPENCSIGQKGNYLHLAAHYGHIPVVELLVAHAIDIDICNNGEETPLEFAVIQENIPMVICLLNLGANINHKSDCNTVLHRALQTSNKKLIKLLLNRGADAKIISCEDRNTIYEAVASQAELDEIKKLRLRHFTTDQQENKKSNALYIIEFLRNAGVNVDNRLTEKEYLPHPCDCTFIKTDGLHNRFACALMAPLCTEEHKRKARLQYKTFLYCLKKNNIPLSKDLKILLLAYLPVITKYAQWTNLVSNHISKKSFMLNFLDDAWIELPTIVTDTERKTLHEIFTLEMYEEDAGPFIIKDLVTDPEKKNMFDPATWAPQEQKNDEAQLKKHKFDNKA